MYQSPYNPNYIVPDLTKFQCRKCEAEFILSEKYDNTNPFCPYCGVASCEAVTSLDDPDILGELGCMAISK